MGKYDAKTASRVFVLFIQSNLIVMKGFAKCELQVSLLEQKKKRNKNMGNRHEERQALHSLASDELKVVYIHTMTVKSVSCSCFVIWRVRFFVFSC